ncbi:hypothetical protein [Streptomyces cavernicola]|uniref:Uncharacterized protein n=1 Tax=Streptomyces cavernicola TaxID=3043613 RepID=A0ABT6SL74_9ACTN|nr:hypothetical protein [Streptomyces sp. B-S-A6]MDI3408940.1 hypothetical protein [Streptomyces sp. B-S-A6]
MPAAELPRHAIDPEAIITEAVLTIEPHLDAETVRRVLAATLRRAPQRRALAAMLVGDPQWLTAGRPQSPRLLERLVRELRHCGAHQVREPRCGRCGQARPLKALEADGRTRICGACAVRTTTRDTACAVCATRSVAFRDRDGRPYCKRHPPEGGAQPLDAVCSAIKQACPGLSMATIAGRCGKWSPPGTASVSCCGPCRTIRTC